MATTVRVDIVGNEKGLTSAINKSESALKSFGQSIEKVGKSMSLALTVPIAGAGFLAFRELQEATKVAGQTEAALKSTGQAAHVSAGQITDLAQSLMKKSGIDDEAIQSGENLLLTFTSIRNEVGKGNDIFTQATKASLDLSVAFGKDMTDSAILVGKALQDPVAGLTALRRVGVSFTESQKETIKSLVEAGDVMGAQKVILKELQTEVGGSAEAYGKTFAGAVSRAKETLLNAGASMLESVAPALNALVDLVQDFANALQDLPSPFKEITVGALAFVAAMGPVLIVVGKLAMGISAIAPLVAGAGSAFVTFGLSVTAALESVGAALGLGGGLTAVLGGIGVAAGLTAFAVGTVLLGAFTSANAAGGEWVATGQKIAQQEIAHAKTLGDVNAQIVSLEAALRLHNSAQQEATKTTQEFGFSEQIAGTATTERALKAQQANATEGASVDTLKARLDELKLQRFLEAAAAAETKGALDRLAAGRIQEIALTDRQRQALTDLQNAYLQSQGGAIGFEAAQIQLARAQEHLTQLENSGTASELDLREARNQVEAATLNVATSAVNMFRSEDDLQRLLNTSGVGALINMRDRLQDARNAGLDNSGALQIQIDKINGVIDRANAIPTEPKTINVYAEVSAVYGQVAGVLAWIESQTVTIHANAAVAEAVAAARGAHGLVGLAQGGSAGRIVRAGQPVVIGEGLHSEAVVPFGVGAFGDMAKTIKNSGHAGQFAAAAIAAGAKIGIGGGGGPIVIENVLVLDGQVVARNTAKHFNRAGGPKIKRTALN